MLELRCLMSSKVRSIAREIRRRGDMIGPDEYVPDLVIERISSELRRLCPKCRAARLREVANEDAAAADKLRAIRLGTPEDD
jgi:hypothetical protein